MRPSPPITFRTRISRFTRSINYDGQLTGNHGIHARFERDLFERFQSRLTLTPARPTPILNVRDAAFDVLLASYQLVDQILKADSEAIAGKDAYDDAYFEAFFAKVRPVLEQRLADSITGDRRHDHRRLAARREAGPRAQRRAAGAEGQETVGM